MNIVPRGRSLLRVIVISALFFSANSFSAELSGTPEELRGYLRSETRTVTISDTAVEVAYSDVAKVTLIVSTKTKTLASAMKKNNDLRDSITKQLTESGIPLSDIQSSKYSASPQFGWFGKSPSSFEVVNSLVVTVEEEPKFRRVAEIADESESITFGGVEFEHSEEGVYEDKVRDQAVDAVMSDRKYFEAKLGLKLQPVSFTFSDVLSSEFDRYRGVEEIIVTASKVGAFSRTPTPAPTSFDEVEYRVSVSVTFEVEQTD